MLGLGYAVFGSDHSFFPDPFQRIEKDSEGRVPVLLSLDHTPPEADAGAGGVGVPIGPGLRYRG